MHLSDVTPNLVVSDIERSSSFYRDILGFAVVTTVPEAPPFDFVWLQRGGVNVFLNARDGLGPDLAALSSRPIGGTNTLFITIDGASTSEGIDRLFSQIDGQAQVVMPLKNQFYGMREFAIEDPDGYIILFAQRIE